MYTATTTTHKLLKLKKRIRAVAGGTSAGKTISILTLLIDDAQSDVTPTLTSIVSESFPHLRRGVMRDFLAIMQEHGYFKDDRWSKTDFTYIFESGSKIEFFSADQPGKVRGPRRDRLFINEANNIPHEAFDQLTVRTKEYIWLDWNPTNSFWFYDEIQGKRDDVDFTTVTYKDNEALHQNIVQDIESHRANKAWWTVYGLGQLGEVEGKIFTGWKIIDDLPHEARLERRGLDFGYSNDPTVVVDIYTYNGGYILDELVYRTGMLNRQIADVIMNSGNVNVLTIADSAEPKSIDEMTSYGVSIIGCEKGPGSVRQRIQYVQGQKVSITKRSLNLIKSYRNFMWKSDRDGKILNEYDHYWSDGMMAASYGLEGFKPYEPEEITPYSQMTSFQV